MNIKKIFSKFVFFALFLSATAFIALAQNAKISGAPRQEKLLNGLKLLIWNEPTATKATVKLRINSGAAFDTKDKEGTMALLADALFPNETAKEFFREDLGGELSVESNYDYIQINASGNSEQILTILETIANAVTKLQIDKDLTAKVRNARLEKLKELENDSAFVADQLVARRLFGSFPYGRSQEGTSESLPKIDFADLILAKQRFLTADNATLAVAGNVKPDYVFKAARQLFGGWEKADKLVPATFAQPDAPDTKFFLVKSVINNASELRFAFRGLARNDKDFYAGQILTGVLQNRLQKKEGDKAVLRQNSYFLPGLVILKFSNWNSGSLKTAGENIFLPEEFSDYVQALLEPNVTPEEFQAAKNDYLKTFGNQNAVDAWLDMNSFQLAPVKTSTQTLQNTTLADAQRVLERWRKEAVVKTLLINQSA